jgi:urease accessory protein
MKLEGLNLSLTQQVVAEPLPSSLVKIEALWSGNVERLSVVPVVMTCEERHRVRRRIRLPDGLEIGLALPTGAFLKPDDVLFATTQKFYRVEAALEDVLIIEPKNLREAAKVAHFIGNLHRDIEVGENTISVLYEPALEIRLQKLGFSVIKDKRPFMGRPTGGDAHKV